MIRTQIQLTEEQAQTLRDLAHRENRSVAELTRQAIDYWLQAAGLVSMDERRRRAMAATGRFRSGRSDISESHDAHLAEVYGQWSSS